MNHTLYCDRKSFDIVNVVIWMADPTAVRGTIPSNPRHKPRTPWLWYVLIRALTIPVWLCWKPTANCPFDWACNCVLTIYSGHPTAEPATPLAAPQSTHNTVECGDVGLNRVQFNWSTVSYNPKRVLFITNWNVSAGINPNVEHWRKT